MEWHLKNENAPVKAKTRLSADMVLASILKDYKRAVYINFPPQMKNN